MSAKLDEMWAAFEAHKPERLRAAKAWERMCRDRRERIATAAMQGLLAKYGIDDSDGGMLDEAVKYADGLIERLDKEVKP
jgi:hypothetical protein